MIGILKAIALIGAMIGSHFEAPAFAVYQQTWEGMCEKAGTVAKTEEWCAISTRAWSHLNRLGWRLTGKDGWLPYDQMRAICIAESASDPQHLASTPGSCSVIDVEDQQP